MALSPRLELKQGQSLVMTPQLQQAIKLLQLSNLELSTYVEQELEKNPLLERDEGPAALNRSNDDFNPQRDGSPSAEQSGEDAPDVSDLQLKNDHTDQSAYDNLDASRDSLYSDESIADSSQANTAPTAETQTWNSSGSIGNSTSGVGANPDMAGGFEATLASEQTLHEHLTEQLTMAGLETSDRMIAQHLINMVNEAGYVTGSLEELAERLGTELDVIEKVLISIQGFEPIGVFARDLSECLAIQLRDKNRYDPAMEALLANIELLAKHDFPALLKICQVNKEDLREMVTEIQELNPKPGHIFGDVVVQPVVPDVFVREGADGNWIVELNTETLPRVLVNQQYYSTVNRSTNSEQEKTYLSDCLADANWLVKSLDQRARTILKVAKELVKQQDGFLAYGIQYLKPLNLKIIADAISMHESTVSRVTNNKYISTPRGVFELKYFFTSSISSSEGGDDHSAESVRHRIKTLIDNETVKSILSDDKIVDMLKNDGIDIARRTVAKYRESMNIPSSVQRRRIKKGQL